MYNFFPRIYDEFMEYADYSKWKDLVINITKKYNVPRDSILDLGCGTGSLLLELNADFSNLYGLDISENMIKKAKEKAKKYQVDIKFFRDDMITFERKEKFNVIVSFFDTLNHILSEEELLLHFKTVKNNLAGNGVYIFDYVDRDFMNEMFKNNIFVDKRENFTCIWQLSQDDQIDFIESTYFVKNKNSTYDKVKEVYTKKIYSLEILKKIIEKSGLKILENMKNSQIAGDRCIVTLGK